MLTANSFLRFFLYSFYFFFSFTKLLLLGLFQAYTRRPFRLIALFLCFEIAPEKFLYPANNKIQTPIKKTSCFFFCLSRRENALFAEHLQISPFSSCNLEFFHLTDNYNLLSFFFIFTDKGNHRTENVSQRVDNQFRISLKKELR